MGERRDVLANTADRNAYLTACVNMSKDMTGLTALDVHRILAPQVPGWSMRGDGGVELSMWDLFSLWHYVAMNINTPGAGANRAHGGPVFLPWHRQFLIRLEEQMQESLRDPNFGLPYWDWARDRQRTSPLWTNSRLGTNRGVVDGGAMAEFQVRLSGRGSLSQGGFLLAHQPRHIERDAARIGGHTTLPIKAEVAGCLGEAAYDASAWAVFAPGFRNNLEGWRRQAPSELHNLVHVWVGGDMLPATSPNDPVFYLNHCNVDRIWEAWMDRRAGRPYAPPGPPGPSVAGHNLNDPMVALLGASMTPNDLLDPAPWYSYDNLTPEV